jgi:hypothetical protein
MNKSLIWITVLCVSVAGYMYLDSKFSSATYIPNSARIESLSGTNQAQESEEIRQKTQHVSTPNPVKAAYMTACVLSTKDFKQSIVDLIDQTELNSIVIDIKDFSGTISFESDNPKLYGVHHGTGCTAKGVKEFIEELHKKNIYVIGRVTVFQDPVMTKLRPDLAVKRASDGGVWKDYKGISFVDVGAKEHWDYMVELAKESYSLGFDEINFDYVRYPSDGNMKDIAFPHSGAVSKPEGLRRFFEYLHQQLKDTGLVTSVDLFGMTTTNYDDLNIGQVLENALPYFDYVAPMVYPSHYPNTFNGWVDPDDHPYDLIYYVMKSGADRAEVLKNATTTPVDIRERVGKHQLRTWIQDFDYGGDYGPTEVRAQINASVDAGVSSWMLWAPSNKYTRDALNK